MSDSSKWIVRPRAHADASLRAFFFAYAGVGPSVFRTWVSEFPAHVEVCLVQPPGRESRWSERPFVSVDAMAAAAAEALLPYLTVPFVFFGHSLGALVSFEVARRLRRLGAPMPLHLFVSGHRAPQLPNPHPKMSSLSDAEFLAQVCRHYGGIPQAVLDNPDLVQLMLPCLRADITAFETYAYSDDTPLSLPVSAFGGRADKRVSQAEVAAWREQTRGRFDLQKFAGGHFFLQSHRDELLSALRLEIGALNAVSGEYR